MEQTLQGTRIDVREYSEFASGYIEGSRLVSLGSLDEASAAWNKTESFELICKSGKRAEQARRQLAALGFASLTVLEGGVDAWRASGKPLLALEKPLWSMERQVRVTAGVLILLMLALSRFLSTYFLLGAAAVGAGLIFAGISDTCMMAFVLGQLPWNRPAHAPASCHPSS